MCEHGDSAPSSTTNDEPHKQTTDENKNLPEDLPNPTGGDGKDSIKDDEKRSERDLQTFRKLYLQKRAQHIAAVDSLLETYEYEKTYQMVDLLITRMRTVVGTSRSTLVQKGFEPGMSFPTDEETKEALSIIMENAGLFGDMALKLPEITHACLEKKKSDVANILKWAITYSSDVGFWMNIVPKCSIWLLKSLTSFLKNLVSSILIDNSFSHLNPLETKRRKQNQIRKRDQE
ncbi:putative coiled-coil domain-containing protein [Apostichopus japonicus]|uniref:Putative coiled-coil domain-containing protein n=1 Tax=Stichopus japonicus TaxID=307972 RepID=A0A2G8KNV5_STIJA|nr:putative coiled-coil domain-containing protein [Apostichopus japonicus]